MIATYRLKRCYFGCLVRIVDGILHVVDGQATVGSFELVIAQLPDTPVAAVLSAEKENRSPVVGEIIGKLASCTS